MKTYLKYQVLISPLGSTIAEHLAALTSNASGISVNEKNGFNQEMWPVGKLQFSEPNRFDTLLLHTCEQLKLKMKAELLSSPRTLVIVSTTKGNLSDISKNAFLSIPLLLKSNLNLAHEPVIVSNACISGVVAVNLANDYVQSGQIDHCIVIGIDVLDPFIQYGFQSLFALSANECKPYDGRRDGINLGEASGVIVLTNQLDEECVAEFLAGASSNDANHISGPSRTGEGLVRAVERTLARSNVDRSTIDFISAHGTATLFNDEMEAVALERLNLNHILVNSFKGYFGHTLGAAGIIELICCLLSMETNTVFKSLGFSENVTSVPLNIPKVNQSLPVNLVLKTASGFGGGNASVLLKKCVC